ncbi:MAG: GNAT family N-acetyltransferase [Treponemataceae bacterium]|nr:GNAT family N-acetyltransferase [Treponemataceae bacterium]
MNAEIDISNVTLKTERLILRPWTLDDVDDLYAYASVEGVGEWAGWLPHKSRDESRKIVESFIRHKKVFAIEYQGKVIGTLGFEEYREAEYPELEGKKARELGFVLSKAYWGKGFMTEAVTEGIRYLFEDVGLDAITCRHWVKNDRSRRVQEKCGFTHVRDSIHNTTFGEERQSWCNILMKEDWKKI